MSLVVLEDVTLFFADRMILDAASLRLGHGDRVGRAGRLCAEDLGERAGRHVGRGVVVVRVVDPILAAVDRS